LWWDGANGEGPNGKKQIYDWDRFKKTVRTLSPSTVIFSDVGPDIRWCGNEKGIAGETNWNLLDTVGFTPGAGSPPVDTLNRGNENGRNWIPAECDVSIRPGCKVCGAIISVVSEIRWSWFQFIIECTP
jgi:alpha-L-fucosidase